MSAAAELANVFADRMDLLAEAARDVVAWSGLSVMTGENLDQTLHAFRGVLLEDLHGEGTEARELLLETVIPALVAEGQTLEETIASLASYAALLGATVPPLLAEEHRGEAAGWLAQFFARWGADVVAAFRRAAEGA